MPPPPLLPTELQFPIPEAISANLPVLNAPLVDTVRTVQSSKAHCTGCTVRLLGLAVTRLCEPSDWLLQTQTRLAEHCCQGMQTPVHRSYILYNILPELSTLTLG